MKPPSPVDQAIEWSIALRSGAVSDAQRSAFDAWRSAHAEHEQAWQKIQSIEQAFCEIPATNDQLAYRVLQASTRKAQGKNRRHALKALGALAVLAVVVPLALLTPWERASYGTAIGERGRFTLSDGTSLQLNTDSRAAVEYSLLRRRIVLERGEILVDTGRDAGSPLGRRRFWVAVGEAHLEALGTRFNVRREGGETRLTVVEGRVAVHSDGIDDTVVHPGETIAIAPHATAVAAGAHAFDPAFDPSAWGDGVLVAKRMRLDAFVAELSRYRAAPLDCDPGVASMQVSGVFQLSGIDPVGHTLGVLTQSLPLRVETHPDGSAVLRKIN